MATDQHIQDVLARHAEAFGDEHDEDCPLCGVDAQQPTDEPRIFEFHLSREVKVEPLGLTLTLRDRVTIQLRESELPLYTDQGGYFDDADLIVEDVIERDDIHQALVLDRYEVYGVADDGVTIMYHRDYLPHRKVEAEADAARLRRLFRDPKRVHLVLAFS